MIVPADNALTLHSANSTQSLVAQRKKEKEELVEDSRIEMGGKAIRGRDKGCDRRGRGEKRRNKSLSGMIPEHHWV